MATSSFADLLIAPAPPRVAAGPPRRRVVIAVAVAVAALTVLAAVLALAGGGDRPVQRVRSADGRFSVVVPDGWRSLRGSELRAVSSAPAAVLRREDGRGLVVVHRRPALARSRRSLTRDLTSQLERRFRDLRPVSARTVKLHGGPAYVYTFARPAARSVQSIAVAPRGGHTYTLDAVTGAGTPDVAAQVGAILRSFDTTNPVPHS
jgi:hypothetical protein